MFTYARRVYILYLISEETTMENKGEKHDDFLAPTVVVEAELLEEQTGSNLVSPGDLKPSQFSKSIMAVYQKLGGDTWLHTQAKENPKEY